MKVINLLNETKKESKSSNEDSFAYLNNFRAISALEGLSTSPAHTQMLGDLANGKMSKQDYIKARMKSAF